MERRGEEPDRVSEGGARRPDIDEAFREGTGIDRAVARAVRDALRMHKRSANPIAASEGGKVIWIPADEIRIDS
jgi:hypothetical protein